MSCKDEVLFSLTLSILSNSDIDLLYASRIIDLLSVSVTVTCQTSTWRVNLLIRYLLI